MHHQHFLQSGVVDIGLSKQHVHLDRPQQQYHMTDLAAASTKSSRFNNRVESPDDKMHLCHSQRAQAQMAHSQRFPFSKVEERCSRRFIHGMSHHQSHFAKRKNIDCPTGVTPVGCAFQLVVRHTHLVLVFLSLHVIKPQTGFIHLCVG